MAKLKIHFFLYKMYVLYIYYKNSLKKVLIKYETHKASCVADFVCLHSLNYTQACKTIH